MTFTAKPQFLLHREEVKLAAEEYNDTAMYRMLSEQRPEGKIKLNPQEKKDFENWLGLDIK